MDVPPEARKLTGRFLAASSYPRERQLTFSQIARHPCVLPGNATVLWRLRSAIYCKVTGHKRRNVLMRKTSFSIKSLYSQKYLRCSVKCLYIIRYFSSIVQTLIFFFQLGIATLSLNQPLFSEIFLVQGGMTCT